MTYTQKAMIVGSAIGALLGAGVAFLLLTAPHEKDFDTKPITGRDLLGFTGSAALLIRKLDDIRRKI
jgi:hypothetical protein